MIVIIYKGKMSQSHSLGLNKLYMGYCSDIVVIIPINSIGVKDCGLNGIISIYKRKASIHPSY